MLQYKISKDVKIAEASIEVFSGGKRKTANELQLVEE